MAWVVEIGDEFGPEFDALAEVVREEILALARLLQQFGHSLGGRAWILSTALAIRI